MTEDKTLTVRSVNRALDILLCFVQKASLNLTEIAGLTHLNKSTVFRLLVTLEKKGFIKRNGVTEKYSLGIRIWELSANLDQSKDPAVLFLPEMEKLRDDLNETISLYIRDGYERIRIQAVESNQTIRRVAPIGARMPLALGASSKILVAYESEEFQEGFFSDPFWPTEVNKEMYRSQLIQIKGDGFALSVEEREAGTAAVSVPIFSRKGSFIAALAVSGPVSRMNIRKMMDFIPVMVESAERMGRLLKD